MGIFSRTTRPEESGQGQQDVTGNTMRPDAVDQPATEHDEDSNVETLSPLALKLQERQRKLDSLKTKIGTLNRSFEQIGALADESATSIGALVDYVEASRTHLETEIRLKSENAKLSTQLLDLNYQVDSLTNQLEESDAQVRALRTRGTETRTALEAARNDLVAIRENNKKINEEYRAQSARLVEANAQVTDMSDELDELKAKFNSVTEHSESVKAELESLSKRETELQQNLSETAALLEAEIKKNKKVNSDLEAVKRELTDTRNENIDVRSRFDVVNQELDYAKTRGEEEQRKHDNQIYSLNSEIENLTSQRRIGAQSLKEMADENKKVKERNRTLVARLQEIEHLLDAAQKNHEGDRNELLSANAKLRELNLRYNSTLMDLNHEKKQNEKYSENMEQLVEENKKLQQYRIKFDTAEDQVRELKSLVSNYQAAMEEAGAMYSRDDRTSFSDEPRVASEEPEEVEDHSEDVEKSDDEDSVVVKLRD